MAEGQPICMRFNPEVILGFPLRASEEFRAVLCGGILCALVLNDRAAGWQGRLAGMFSNIV